MNVGASVLDGFVKDEDVVVFSSIRHLISRQTHTYTYVRVARSLFSFSASMAVDREKSELPTQRQEMTKLRHWNFSPGEHAGTTLFILHHERRPSLLSIFFVFSKSPHSFHRCAQQVTRFLKLLFSSACCLFVPALPSP